MSHYVAVTIPRTDAEVRRTQRDPATYGLNERRQRIGQTWQEAPIQRGVTPDQPCSGLRVPSIRKVG